MIRTMVVLGGLLVSAATAAAQVQMQPTPPPIVDAASDAWYQRGEPISYAGELYYPGGAAVFFNGHHMVRTGHYNGVPLYADATLEPFSLVYVPIGNGLMQPYERPRRGQLAGTTGSRPPSFPVGTTPPPPPAPVVASSVGRDIPHAVGTRGVVVPTPQPARPLVTVMRPESNDGIWIRFGGEKWVSDGPAVPLDAAALVRVGEHAGFPVFAKRPLDEEVIYVPTRAGLVAPYRLKK